MSSCFSHDGITLYDLQRQYGDESFLVPIWQRGKDVWNERKRINFEKTVRDKMNKGVDDFLTGCVIIYSTEDNPTKKYISDGLQRACNLRRLFVKLVAERGEVGATADFRRINVVVLKMIYKDEKEAKDDYRKINQGSPLTPSEAGRTILSELPNFKDWEDRVFKPLNEAVHCCLVSCGCKIIEDRNRSQMSKRDDYGLFLRYLTKETRSYTYTFSLQGIDDSVKGLRVLERRLVGELGKMTTDEAQKQVTYFGHYLDLQTQIIKSIWDKVKVMWPGTEPTPACFRFLLHLTVFCKNNTIPLPRYEDFIERFFKHCGGRGYFQDPSTKKLIVLGLGFLSKLPRIQELIGVVIDPNLNSKLKRQRKKTDQLSPGMHNAHINAVSRSADGDDGKTIPLPGIKNMSMGVQSIPAAMVGSVTGQTVTESTPVVPL